MSEPLKVLIVEDMEDDCLLVVKELQKQGFDPSWKRVQTGPTMREALGETDWELVLSDYRLPRLNAPAALQLLKDSGMDLPFIVISGTIGEHVAVQTMRQGAHDYLMKGNLSRLGEAIRRELREAKNRREREEGVRQIGHLNRVLRAIRDINQLIMREREPRQLLDKACQCLVKTRGYDATWAVLLDGTDVPSFVCGSGFGEAWHDISADMEIGKLPTCATSALNAPDVMHFPSCPECAVHQLGGHHTSMAMRIEHSGHVYGVMAAMLRDPSARDETETSLFSEMVEDVAFALFTIEQSKMRLKAEVEKDYALRKVADGEARLAQILNALPVGVVAVDTNGVPKFVNRSAEQLLGRGLLHDTDRDSLVSDLGAHIKGTNTEYPAERMPIFRGLKGETSFVDDMEILAEERRVPLHVRGAPIFNRAGDVDLSVAVFSDVTEQVNAQAQLAQSDRLASMGMLAAGVAHEINNPLAYILYNLESLSDDLPRLLRAMAHYQARVTDVLGADGLDNVVGRAAREMSPSKLGDIQARFLDALGGTRRIRDIARGLGTFSRVERDELAPVSLMYVIEAALNMCFNEIKYRARVIKDYGRTPTIMASEGRLSQVFLNLLVNAAHAIDEGDVDGNGIYVRTWAEGDAVFAEVRDTGKGIAQEHIGQLFEPFFTTKELGVGSGLGLPISKGIVESYGGTISVESEPGKGAAFSIRLPAGAQEPAPAPTATLPEKGEPVRGRILVVDDEDAIRAVMGRILCDHEIVEAASGEVAIELLETDQAFDLILCDMMMPRVSGMDVHRWLVEENPKLASQVVFITGGAFTPKAREYLNSISNIRVEKPFNVSSFKKNVSELIVAHQARQRIAKM